MRGRGKGGARAGKGRAKGGQRAIVTLSPSPRADAFFQVEADFFAQHHELGLPAVVEAQGIDPAGVEGEDGEVAEVGLGVVEHLQALFAGGEFAELVLHDDQGRRCDGRFRGSSA